MLIPYIHVRWDDVCEKRYHIISLPLRKRRILQKGRFHKISVLHVCIIEDAGQTVFNQRLNENLLHHPFFNQQKKKDLLGMNRFTFESICKLGINTVALINQYILQAVKQAIKGGVSDIRFMIDVMSGFRK